MFNTRKSERRGSGERGGGQCTKYPGPHWGGGGGGGGLRSPGLSLPLCYFVMKTSAKFIKLAGVLLVSWKERRYGLYHSIMW